MVFMCWASVISAGCGLCIAASGPSPLPRSPWHWAHSSKYSPRAAFKLASDGGSGFLSFLNSSGTSHGLFCCQAEYASTMQIRTSTEAKRILRVFRLGCAMVDMAAKKILAQRTTQRKQTWRRLKRPVLLLRTENEPDEFGVEKEDCNGNGPSDHHCEARIGGVA